MAALLAQWQKDLSQVMALPPAGMDASLYAANDGGYMLNPHADDQHIFVLQVGAGGARVHREGSRQLAGRPDA